MINKLPHRIRLSSKDHYSVVVVPRFDNERDLWHCDPNINQIRLVIDKQSEKKIISNLFHEILHQINYKYGLNLTEAQVLGLEDGIINLFKLNSVFSNLFFKTFVKRMTKK